MPHYSPFKREYASCINTYKEVLDLPFYFHTRAKEAPTFYVLQPEGYAEPGPVQILDKKVRPKPVAYPPELDDHVLLKLLLAYYFYRASEQERRITQAHFLMSAKAKGRYHTALEVSLRQQPEEREDNWVDFCLDFQSQFIEEVKPKKLKPEYLSRETYYEPVMLQQRLYYRQLKTSKVMAQAKKGKVYRKVQGSHQIRPQLNWFQSTDKENKYKYSRSYLLYQLQQCFCTFVNELLEGTVLRVRQYEGFEELRVRKYKEKGRKVKYWGYVAPPEKLETFETWKQANSDGSEEDKKQAERLLSTGLPYGLLPEVYVYDNRLRDLRTGALLSEVPFAQLLGEIRKKMQGMLMPFKVLALKELEHLPEGAPLLVLQDVEKAAFDADKEAGVGFLLQVGYKDPKEALYHRLQGIAKQSISVNPLPIADKDGGLYNPDNWRTYFAYDAEDARKQVSGDKLEVSLNELLLKWLLAQQRPMHLPGAVAASMPLFEQGDEGLGDFCYLQGQHLLYFDEGLVPRICCMETPEGKKEATEFLKAWADIDMREQVRRPLRERKRTYKQSQEEEEEETEVAEEALSGNMLLHRSGTLVAIERQGEYPRPRYELMGGESNRQAQLQVGLRGVWFHFGLSLYAVGTDNMNGKEERGNPLYKLHVVNGTPLPQQTLETLARSLTVRFVRHQRYTVFPYPFDLLRLWGEVKQ